jgi:hypothetical protein
VEDVVAHHLPSGRRAPDTHRAQLIMRNGILTAVMRRPWRVVLRRVEQAARSGPTGRRALAAAGRRLPSAMRARHRVPPFVERRVEALEAVDDLRPRGSTAK